VETGSPLPWPELLPTGLCCPVPPLDRPDRHVLSSTGEDQNYEKDHPNRRVRNGHQYRGLSAAAGANDLWARPDLHRIAGGTTVTNFYKQNVYDPSDNKIGDVDDVLIDKEGHVTAMIIGVGGFLGRAMAGSW